MKIIFKSLLLSLVLVSLVFVRAVNVRAEDSGISTRPSVTKDVIKNINAIQAAEGKRMQFATMQKKESDAIAEKVSQFQKQLLQKQTALEAKIKTKQDKLIKQLGIVKDQNKKQMVQVVDSNLDALNQKITNSFADTINDLEKVLANIVSRTDKAELNGADVTLVRKAIASAEKTVDAGRTAVLAQAGKTYPITVKTEDTLGANAGKARDSLKNDLSQLNSAILKIKGEIKKAADSLAQIPNVDSLEIPESPQIPATSASETPEVSSPSSSNQ